jgi:uncharacterized repeat protein (TIGR02543 family)
MTYRAHFTQTTTTDYIIQATAATGGTVSFIGGAASANISGTFALNSTVNLVAAPNANYVFEGWYEMNNSTGAFTRITGAGAIYSFTVSASRTLQARFTPTTTTNHIITTSVSPANSGGVAGGGSYPTGAAVTLTATPSTGFTFEGWYEGNTRIPGTSTIPTYTFTAAANRTIQARFTQATTHTITASVSPANSGDVTGGGSYPPGTIVHLIATPRAGYAFEGWYENNVRISTSATFTLTVLSNRTIQARFIRATTYTITTSVSPANSGTATSGGTHASGATVTLVAAPNTGYVFDGWYEGNVRVSINAAYTFTATANRTLQARFTTVNHTIISTAGIGGTVTDGGTYATGASVTLRATPNAGYTFDGWYEGNTLVSTNATYTFNATANRTLQARFTQATINYTITATAGTGGGATGGGSYASGASVTLRATANAGYTFDGWYEGNTIVSTDAIYQFNASSNRTLQARFTQVQTTVNYTITATAGTGGSATGGGSYTSGAGVTVRATADSGYVFDGWYENGAWVSSNTAYTFPASSNRTLQARFTEDSTPLYGDLNGDGAVNSADLILMQKYFAQPGVTIDLAAADVNGDDAVNSADLILLQKYFAQPGIVLGP